MMDAVLILDSEKQSYQQLRTLLEFIECESVIYTNPNEWRENPPSSKKIALVFLAADIDEDLAAFVSELDKWGQDLPLILLTKDPDDRACAALPKGTVLRVLAYPFKYQDIVNSLHQAKVYKKNQTQSTGSYAAELFRSLVGDSRSIKQVRTLIEQVAPSEATVLILGESGTGKEVVARNIHYYSDRRDKPFVPINCGAIPADLLESELFGHEKGAFTGAISARQGRFELADGGTLFLDEIGDMSMQMQVKLLRVLQERNFSRVGSNKLINVSVRIIAATHRDLDEAIKVGDFREDLYYRLNVFPIEMPPLRERVEDISLLVNELVKRFEHENRGSVRLTRGALLSLCQYPWPGNVRELANLIERLLIIYPYGVVDTQDLPDKFQADPVEIAENPGNFESLMSFDPCEVPRLPREGIDLKEHLATLEYKLIKQALDDAGGVVAHAANRLKLRRTTLVEKLRKFDLQASEKVS